MEKIKINFSQSEINWLNYDAETFNIYKANGETNINLLLNIIFYQIYRIKKEAKEGIRQTVHEYLAEYRVSNAKLDRLVSILNDKKDMDNQRYRKERLDCPVAFRFAKQYEWMYCNIINEDLKDMTLSAFFRNMVLQYFHMLQVDREKLLFRDDYQTICDCIETQRMLRINLGNKESILFAPYTIQENQESTFIYLYGLEDGKEQPTTYHLYKIANKVFMGNGYYNFSSNQLATLKKGIDEQGIQFASFVPMTAEVEVDRAGAKMIKAIFYNRPLIIKKARLTSEYSLIVFRGSFESICQYVYRLNEHAFIRRPIELSEYVYRLHKRAYQHYEEKIEQSKAHHETSMTDV